MFRKCNLTHHRERAKSQWRASVAGAAAQEISAEVAAVFSKSDAVFIFNKNKGQHGGVLSVGELSRLRLALLRVPLNHFNYESSGASPTKMNFPVVQSYLIGNENTTVLTISSHLSFPSSSVVF